MKIMLFLLFALSFASCGNGAATKSTASATVHTDTPAGAVIADSTGASEMNADTTGMSHAK